MSNKPIILEQIVNICGFESQFTTKPNISKKQLINFFDDISLILKEIDKDINYEGELFEFYKKGHWWTFSIPIKLSRMQKSLQVITGNSKKFNIDNIVRTHNINYKRNPSRPDWLEEKMKNNIYKHIMIINTNLTITSTKPTYKVDDLVDALKQLPYVDISDKYDGYVFNPQEVIAAKDNPNKFITTTGRVITLHNS